MNDRDAFCRSLDVRPLITGLRLAGLPVISTGLGAVHYDLRLDAQGWMPTSMHAVVAVYAPGTSWKLYLSKGPHGPGAERGPAVASGDSSQFLLVPVLLGWHDRGLSLTADGVESVVVVELLLGALQQRRPARWPSETAVALGAPADRPDVADRPGDGTTDIGDDI